MTTNNPKQPVTPREEFEELCRSAIKQGLICPHPETFWNWHTSQMKKFAEEIKKDTYKELMMMSCGCQFRVNKVIDSLLKKWGLEGER